jgi:hypothetical protein
MPAYNQIPPGALAEEEPPDPTKPSGLPGDTPLHSERAIWLYLLKGMAILFVCAFALTNAMYGFFELLTLLGE